jgi:hypothetical protein
MQQDYGQPWSYGQQPPPPQQPSPPQSRTRSRGLLYAGLAVLLLAGAGCATHTLTVAGGKPLTVGSGKPLRCAQQYQQWRTGPADALSKSTFGPDWTALNGTVAQYSADIPAMKTALAKLASDAAKLEQFPMPTCADPAGYWQQMLGDFKAARDNAASLSRLDSPQPALAPIERVMTLETRLQAELARTAGVQATP